MAEDVVLICPTAKVKSCPSGCFAEDLDDASRTPHRDSGSIRVADRPE
jgi:hypothetical protein